MAAHKRVSRERRQLDTDVYTLACERVAHAFDSFDHVLVAFSGGKDSTAVLNVALEVAHSDPRYERHLPLRVIFQDEEAIPYETEEYVRRVSQRDDVALEWLCIPIKHRNACSRLSPWWWPWAPEARERWCRPLPPEARTELAGFPLDPPESRLTAPDANGLLAPPELGNCALLMGIRAQESLTRLSAVSKVGPQGLNYVIKFDQGTSRGNLYKVYPVYDWSSEDVWTAPATKGWDYNAAYDRQEMAGISKGAQRCSPAFGEEPIQKLWMFAHCFPEVWELMVDRVPGVGAAVRYATTELYGFHGKPPKPEGASWPEWCAHYLKKFGAAEQASIAQRMQDLIAHHYRRTTHPILADAPHPDSGLHWEFLFHMAMRGNFKNRRMVSESLKGKAPGDLWRAYADAMARHIADGTTAELAYPRPFPADPYALIPTEYRDAE